MPKFLDVPTWISKSGKTVEALGLFPGQQTGGKGAGIPYVTDAAVTDVWYIGRANGYGAIPYCDGNGISFGYIAMNGSFLYPDMVDFYAPITSGTDGQVLVSNGNGIAPGWGPKITAWQGMSTTIGNFITHDEAGVLFVWGNTGLAGLIKGEDLFDFCIIVKTKSEDNAYYITINGSTVQRMSVATTSATISTQSASVITVLSILAEDVTQQ